MSEVEQLPYQPSTGMIRTSCERGSSSGSGDRGDHVRQRVDNEGLYRSIDRFSADRDVRLILNDASKLLIILNEN